MRLQLLAGLLWPLVFINVLLRFAGVEMKQYWINDRLPRFSDADKKFRVLTKSGPKKCMDITFGELWLPWPDNPPPPRTLRDICQDLVHYWELFDSLPSTTRERQIFDELKKQLKKETPENV